MGEAEIITSKQELVIRSDFCFYGDAASDSISRQVAEDIETHWNEAKGKVRVDGRSLLVRFEITGSYDPLLMPLTVYENINPRINYFRIEEHAEGNISFVDAINCNTGYFQFDNLLNNSTTAAHEYGHTLGLTHPEDLDIRGKGTPGIMYPRGTLVDPPFQYSPEVKAGEKGGTLNPFKRKVLASDIDSLRLHRLDYDRLGFAVIGEFTSIWHDKHLKGQ